MRLTGFLCGVIVWAVCGAGVMGAEFFVAPGGAVDGDGSEGRPWASVARARGSVRVMRQAGVIKGDVTVWLRGGRHVVGEALVFGPDDSNVTYAAYRDERPVIDAGVRVTGWREERVNGRAAWVTELPEVAGGTVYYKSLFVNGERRARPRWPKVSDGVGAKDVLRAEGSPNVKVGANGALSGTFDVGDDRFTARAGDFIAKRNVSDVDVVVLHYWSEDRMPVASYDPAMREVVSTIRSNYSFRSDHSNEYARYYLDNVAEALSEPGEWYLDRRAGRLTYLPMAGETIAKTDVVAGRDMQIVRIMGTAEKPVENLRFRGIEFRNSDWPRVAEGAKRDPKDPKGQWTGVQSAVGVAGAIEMAWARGCRIEDCVIKNVGGYGVQIGDGCRGVLVTGCEIGNCAAGGVHVSGAGAGGAEAARTGESLISDNHIHDFGQIFHAGTGVLLRHAYGMTVAHNHIHDGYYSGVCCGWVWGYLPNVSRDNRIEFNHIHDLGKRWLSDMGGVYTLGPQPGTVVRNNVIHDVNSASYGGWGVYTDEGSSNIVIENNVLYRFSSEPFHQHYGKENVVRNNVLAFGGEAVARISRSEAHKEVIFERNVFVTDGPPLYYEAGAAAGGNFTTDHNVMWDVSGKAVRWHPGATEEQWKSAGKDVHSIVADPGFKDAKGGDFTVVDGGMATANGFVPIDVSKVGPRAKGKRGG